MSEVATSPDLSLVSSAQWDQARRYFPIIRQLIDNSQRTRAEVITAAAELGCGPTHVYALLRRYLADPRLTSLLPGRRGPKRGRSRLAAEIDALISETIETVYLTRQRPRMVDLVLEVRRRCHARGLRAPGRKAIRARLRARPAHEVLAQREGRKAARDRFAPAVGSLQATWPLSLIQIDHTLVDVIVVDSVTRAPIQRPWITLAIDVYSRCVAGFHLSLEPPSATSVALCIAHAALAKEAWLLERGIQANWPVHGLFSRLHLDNAKEFHCEALRRGCEQYGIGIDYRPVRTPHYGGHIERLIGTMMGKVHLLPGTTFSDVRIKGDLDPQKTAVMTIEEVERWLGHAITGLYHGSVHRSLHTTPLVAWERGLLGDAIEPGPGQPVPVPDPKRFLIDFLPIERRLIRREGVSLHSISYWSDILTAWIGQPEKMIVRYDPRDLSRIYLLAPDGQYYELTYRNLQRPSISLWEHRLALRRLRAEGRSHVDEVAIFRTIECMRAITEAAVNSSKSARRQHERRLRLIPGGLSTAVPVEPVCEPSSNAVHDVVSVFDPTQMLPVEEWS